MADLLIFQKVIFFWRIKKISENRPLYIITDFLELEDIFGSYLGAGCRWAQIDYFKDRDYVTLYYFGDHYGDDLLIREYGRKWFAYIENPYAKREVIKRIISLTRI